MRTWLGSILFVVLATFGVASGCGSKAEVVTDGEKPDIDASVGGGSSSNTGSGATGGGFVFGDGGDAGTGNGCQSTCEDLKANCGYVTDTICGGVIKCPACPKGEFCGGDGPNRCGIGMSGEGGACSGPDCPVCVPKTCEDIGFTCGPAPRVGRPPGPALDHARQHPPHLLDVLRPEHRLPLTLRPGV